MTDKDNEISYEEYNTLRAEILQNHKNCLQILTFVITGTVVIFGIAVKNYENWFLFMLPLVILIPCLYLYLDQVDATFRMGSYIRVFLEANNDELNYETRWSQYRENVKPDGNNSNIIKKLLSVLYNNSSLIIFYSLSVICSLIGLFSVIGLFLLKLSMIKLMINLVIWLCISVVAFVCLYPSFSMNKESVFGIEKQDEKWEATLDTADK